MYIDKIAIENFRSIKNAEVSLDAITAFVGRNGVGKSTVLYALDSFFNVGAHYTSNDFYNHDSANLTIKIRITFAGLRPDELAEFGAHVVDGKLVVSKVITSTSTKYFGTTMQLPAFAEFRKLSAREKRSTLVARLDEFPEFGEMPRNDAGVDTAMEQYERAHPALLQAIEKETEFLGPKNVGGGKLDKFTKFVLVPAVRDAATEMEKRGAIMQLLDMIVARSINGRADFAKFKQDFEAEARRLYGRDNLPELEQLGRLITERLARYSPGAELTIDFAEIKPPTIPLPDAVVMVSEDQFKVPVRYTGHGLQRALILALLEQLSATQAAPVPATVDNNVDAPLARSPDLILAIEEPELYLHPARSRYMAKILRKLASLSGAADRPDTQIVYVSHSPYFVGIENFDQVRMCRKIHAGDGPRATEFKSYSKDQAATRLAQLMGRRPEEFTGRSFATRAAPVLNTMVNEGLFAEVAVVVEGESDVAALWTIQESLNLNWEEKGVVIVAAGGKNNMDRVVVTFQGFGIPTFFVWDGDRTKNETAGQNRMLAALGQIAVADYPPTTIGDHAAVFEDDIETYLEGIAGNEFIRLRQAASNYCEFSRPTAALKNSEVMARFFVEMAAAGLRADALEQIVRRITAIAEAVN